MNYRVVFLVIGMAISITGCASFGQKLKSFMSGEPTHSQSSVVSKQGMVRYSEKPDNPAADEGVRQYRRMTREMFEKDAHIESESGSLWTMEGQASYLFSQNMTRIVGDPVNVRVDGEPKKQLETKSTVISNLLKKASRPRAPAADPNAAAKPGESAAKTDEKDSKGADAAKTADASSDKDKDKDKDDDKSDSPFSVSQIPSRIVEKLSDGSYRVRGSQTFMIGKNEYRVIATGIVRSSDITDDGVDSSRLLDSKFDIVSLKKESKQ